MDGWRDEAHHVNMVNVERVVPGRGLAVRPVGFVPEA